MAYRVVTHLVREDDGEITMLCNHRETWSPRLAADAIEDIENGVHTYYMSNGDGVRSTREIAVREDADRGKVLVIGYTGQAPDKP